MRINNNTAAFNVWSSYSANTTKLQESMSRLSTGVIKNTDDPAGVGISENMRSDIKGTAMARNNTENAISMMQTADAWAQKISDMLNRMKSLAIEAKGVTSDADKTNINAEFKAMQEEIKRITDGDTAAAQFNGENLFDATSKNIQIGAKDGQAVDVVLADLQSTAAISTVVGAMTISTLTDNDEFSVTSSSAIAHLDTAINYVSNERAQMAAQQNRLSQTRDGLLAYEDNLTSAESKVRDVDMARETTNFSKYQVLTNTANAMLAQANKLSQGVQQLLNF
ncbi:flagellin [Lentisphaerota bacterium WC36G]|nr:flagellin [Lentisphaerae bacterium WC36]